MPDEIALSQFVRVVDHLQELMLSNLIKCFVCGGELLDWNVERSLAGDGNDFYVNTL